jgi:hypothetical protein
MIPVLPPAQRVSHLVQIEVGFMPSLSAITGAVLTWKEHLPAYDVATIKPSTSFGFSLGMSSKHALAAS